MRVVLDSHALGAICRPKAGDRIAAVIVEPVAGNMGIVPPAEGFLKGLRAITTKHGALLVCDEVINGFRFGFSSYSALYGGVTPELHNFTISQSHNPTIEQSNNLTISCARLSCFVRISCPVDRRDPKGEMPRRLTAKVAQMI